MFAAGVVLLASAAAVSAPDVAAGIAVALQACEEWVTNPATHAGDPEHFAEAVHLEGQLLPQPSVPDVALPPPQLRLALRHWRVPLGGGGIYVTMSDTLPMCHLAGGGPFDFQPGVQQELKSGRFGRRWRMVVAKRQGGVIATMYRRKDFPSFSMVLSRADAAGDRTDHVQLLITAQYDTRN